MAGLASATPTPAGAEAFYPSRFDVRALTAWLVQETELRPEQVVAVSRTSLAAIVGAPEERAGAKRVTVRSEALAPDPQEDGALSSQSDVYVDCAHHLTRQGASTGHPERNLAGIGHIIAIQELNWRFPLPGTQLESIWRAVCDPTFQRPLLSPPASEAHPVPAHVYHAAAPAPTPPVRVPASPRLKVQVGAYPSDEAAQAASSALRAHLPTLMEGRSTEIAQVRIGATSYYRLLVRGFRSVADEQGFCRILKGGGRECFPRNAPPPEARRPLAGAANAGH
jgi:hypothetical protein